MDDEAGGEEGEKGSWRQSLALLVSDQGELLSEKTGLSQTQSKGQLSHGANLILQLCEQRSEVKTSTARCGQSPSTDWGTPALRILENLKGKSRG